MTLILRKSHGRLDGKLHEGRAQPPAVTALRVLRGCDDDDDVHDDTMMMMIIIIIIVIIIIQASFNRERVSNYLCCNTISTSFFCTSWRNSLSKRLLHKKQQRNVASDRRISAASCASDTHASTWHCTRQPITIRPHHHHHPTLPPRTHAPPHLACIRWLLACIRWLRVAASVVAQCAPTSRLHQVAPCSRICRCPMRLRFSLAFIR